MAQLTIQQTFDQAVRHHQAGRLQEAERLYRKILIRQPKHAPSMHLLGMIANQEKHYDIAADLIRRSIALSPNVAEAHNDLGIALKSAERFDEAIIAFRRAVAIKPNFADAHSNLGVVLTAKGQFDEAVIAYRQAIALRPNYAEAHNNLGNVLKDKGQLDEAIAAFRQAISLMPNYPEAYNNLGDALKQRGYLDDSVAAYRQAIAFNLNLPEAYSNLGNALSASGRTEEAIAAYCQAIALKPDFSTAHGNLIFTTHYHPGYSAQAIADEHSRWNQQHAEPLRKLIQPPSTSSGLAHTNNRDPDRPLRIGYVSSDLKKHSVGYLVIPLLENHDRSRFQIFCYANVKVPDSLTERFQRCCDVWRNIVGMADQEIADLVRSDGIDILVDLAGHTAGNCLLVFARKPAPIQVTYVGYPNTTGLTAMDYRLSDALADPPGMTDPFTVEKLWRLSPCAWVYQPTDDMPEITPHPAGPIVFGGLNNFTKVNRPLLELWAGVLKKNPDSRLLILVPRGKPQESILKTLTENGVDPARIELLAPLERAGYLRTFNRVDISLDTYPYDGTVTTCESLWMGVPVVSLAGQTHVSRVGVSLLSNIGLGELVAESAEQYVRIATELAQDVNRLNQLRSTMRERMRQSPLMDAKHHAGEIENAYRQMWRGWCETAST